MPASPAPQPPTPTDPPPTPSIDGDSAARLSSGYGGVLQRLYAWAFGPVTVPPEVSEDLRRLADRGVVVYIGRSAVFVTFLFFQHLFLRIGAPVAQAVVGLGTRTRRWWWRPVAGRRLVRAPKGDDVVAAVKDQESALIFLRRPGSLVAAVRDVRDPFPELVAAQRQLERPIFLVPQLLIWERRARHLRRTLFDALFGEPEAPGLWRSLISFIWNRRRAFVKFGDPINLKEVIAASEGLDDRVIARKVRGALHHHLARETRVVIGPPLKEPARLVAETLRDRSLRSTLAEISRERGRADTSVEREAAKDLKEIAATYSPRMLDFMKWLMDLVFDRIYDGVEVDQEGLARIARTNAKTPIVVCPSHKSHMDYLVMSAIFAGNNLIPPHIAAGINLSFWPLGTIFRKSGAFFIRRTFKGDKVYSAVMKAYIRKLVKDGFTQEFFVEGSRSRTGKVLLPKFGMLAMEVDAWIDGARPDIAFCPTWIGYAQIIEASSYARELSGGEKEKEDLGALLRTPKVLTSRYGRIYIRFDHPLSLDEIARLRSFDRAGHTEEEKRDLVRALGFRIVEGINHATALTPSGLLCTALLAHDRRGLAAPDLTDRLQFLLDLVLAAGGRPTFTPEPGALDVLGKGPIHEARAALEHAKALVVHETGGEHIFAVVERERMKLDYHKNSALHFFVADALLATALLTTPSLARTAIEARTLALSRLFKHEFIYGAGPFPALFARRLAHLAGLGLVEDRGTDLVPTRDGAPRLRLLADLLVNYVESYLVATEGLALLLAGPLDLRALVQETLEKAKAGFLAGRIRKFESLSKVTFENAFTLFEEEGVLVRVGEKGRQRALAPAFANEDALHRRADELRAMLVEKAE